MPTVISAIGGAPQNCTSTGSSEWLVPRSANAVSTASSSAAASAQTTVAAVCRPGTVTGSVAAAMATIPVPMTQENQLGPNMLLIVAPLRGSR